MARIFYPRRSADRQTLFGRFRRVMARLLLIATILGAAWATGLVWFVQSMPDEVEDPASQTDVIVVLTGGSERLHTGLELLKAGMAGTLFVSGVHAETTLDAILREEGPLPDALRDRIELGYIATDTVGNAIETAIWLRERGNSSLRLVTAAYHMPRSLLEFQTAMPNLRLVPHPVFPDIVKRDEWWRYPGTAQLFAVEYTKYLVVHLRLLFPDRPLAPAVFQTPERTSP